MPLSDAGGAPLTLLGSMRELDDGELPQLYGYPEGDGRWLRANFIASVDGGATADGKTGTMGGPGDRLIFHVFAALAEFIRELIVEGTELRGQSA